MRSLTALFSGQSFEYFHDETLQDSVLNVPGVTVGPNVGILTSGATIDSVDADDELTDGFGNSGGSFYMASGLLRADFDAAVLSALPTHVGLVWTDAGFSDLTIGLANVEFEAYDENLVSLGRIGPFTLGDGAFSGQTLDDRFSGWTHAGGIRRIELRTGSTDWKADHLQYGRASAIPEPGTSALMIAGCLGLLLLRGGSGGSLEGFGRVAPTRPDADKALTQTRFHARCAQERNPSHQRVR